MTFTASDVIAALAIFATMLVAWIGHLDRTSDRDHEQKMARESRQQDRRATTYRDMMAMAFTIQAVVNETLPGFELRPAPPPTEMPSGDVQRQMGAAVAAFGSPEVVGLYGDLVLCVNKFSNAARLVSMLSQPEGMRAAPDVAQLWVKAREDLEPARQAVTDAVNKLEQAARTELAG
jgi:hypothetical protein